MNEPKRSRGRPPKSVKADLVLPTIRVTADQRASYDAAADAAGTTLSGWIKATLDREAEKHG